MTSRTYRFAPLDRRTWLLGLSGIQCILLGVGLAVSATLLRLPIPLPVSALPVLLATAMALVPVGGQPGHEVAATGLSYARAKPNRPSLAPIPLFVGTGSKAKVAPPPALEGVEIREVPRPEWAGQGIRGVAVVEDAHKHESTVVLRTRSSGFALASASEQDRLLGAWGDVLASFCTESSAVSRLVASQHVGAADVAACRQWIEDNGGDGDAAARAGYGELLDDVARVASSHSVLITLTTDRRRSRQRNDDATLVEARRLVERLDAANVTATLLSPQELVSAVSARIDPTRPQPTSNSLSRAPGLAPVSPWPLAHRSSWNSVFTDGAIHRTWWIAEWPRLDVPAAWLDPLLSARVVNRTVVLYFEPVRPSLSRRRIERDATRLATDAEQRVNRGFRVGARHRRSTAAVEEREAELVAGYAEVGVVGLVVATASSDTAMESTATQISQAASAAGLELRQLDGRHDLALAASLPLGRPIQAPRL